MDEQAHSGSPKSLEVIATRRLAALVIADVVGYTRLMERDDTGTFAQLGSIRSELIDPSIVSHGGRIVQTAGDGWLAEFPSALAALRASIQIQRAMSARNAAIDAGARIDYRMGVNLGDIIVQGTEIAGDGVNVASRLESLAEPGAICISSAVREQVHGQLDAELIDIGEQHVKNIARPIRVYRVVLDRSAAKELPRKIGRRPVWSPRMAWGLAAGAILVLSTVALLIVRPWDSKNVSSSPLALSLAILPFAASSSVPAEEQFAAALTENLTTALGQWRWAHVSGSGAVAEFKGKGVDARTIGRQLNVRYIVEGDVRKTSDSFFVTVHLIDALTGAQASSDKLEFRVPAPPQPVPHLQMAKRLRTAVLAAEVRRATKEKSAAEPMDLVLRGRGVLAFSGDVNQAIPEARVLFDKALVMQGDFVPALFGVLQTYDTELEEFNAPDRAAILSKADSLTSRMIGIDRSDDAVWRARAIVLQWLGRFDEAMVADERAQLLAPWSSEAVLDRPWILIQTGRSKDAFPLIQQAIEMDPLEQSWPYHFLCKAQLFVGQYADAVSSCEKAATENDWWLNQVYLCAAYGQHGDIEKAVTSKNAILKQQPGYTIDRYRRTYAASPPAFFDQVEQHLAPGLRKAGLPER